MHVRLDSLSWSLVQSFLAVASEGSLSGAARLLGTSQPTVGRQIRQIEEQLGVTLFHRQPRGLKLTDTGQQVLGPAQAMADAMRQISLTAAGRSYQLAGPVRITASVFTAHYILPGIIARIRRDEPDISVDIVASDSSDNLLFREADIAVRMYRTEQLDIVTRHLGDIDLGLFAATSYLDRVGRPETVQDLQQLDFVGYDRSELIIRGMREAGWDVDRDWFHTRCDHHGVYWELVRAGCGVGFAQCHVAQADPLVKQLFPEMPIPKLPLWLAAHEAMRRTPRIARVWDMLATGIAPFVS